MIYLLSEKRLKADFLNDNIDSSLILPSIQTAQDIYLRQTLGDSLLDKICNMVRDNELEEPYKTLLDDYIIIYLEYLAMAELCVPSSFKIGNIGVAQAYDANVNTQTIQNVKYLESYYKQKASFYENRLTTFIQQHCNLYPEYRDTTTVTTAQESTLQCGIYLGGTTSRKKIINNNTNNNTEVGNYVRYDKAQNLSELEKAQARENIGVSASGDIVVDLENYYTKDEVFNKTEIDTKLIPYITDNEVNLRLQNYYTKSQTDTAIQNAVDNIEIPDIDLSNYYTKETVNNLLDNLPIPEATSELVKDDVYTKSEVDNLIANSGGGGSNTPSNTSIVDIMALTYDEQLELINFVIDNNRFPNLNTLYTYQGYILNNLRFYSDWWNEENNERYITFDVYAHPLSYSIRFITYQWNEGKIYNDINEKDYNDWLVTNIEIDTKLDRLVNGLALDLYEYDNDELAHVYNKIYYMGEQFTDKPITYRGKFINNITIEGENVRFWHYAITTDSNNINSDKSFYVDVEMYDVIMGLVRTIYTEIGDCTVIGGNGGGTTDLSNYYNKQQVDTLIAEIPTFSGNYEDLNNKPSIYTQNEIDTLISNINEFSGDYNDLTNKPTLFDGDYNSLENKPTLSTVATSGSYNDLENKPIVDLLSLPNNEQVSEIDFYSDINQFTSNKIITIEGVVLNGNKCVYETIDFDDSGMPIKQVDFHINRTANSFIIRFITRYGENNENIPYEFIYTNENGDMLDTLNLVTKSELDLQIAEINTTLGNINNILNTI